MRRARHPARGRALALTLSLTATSACAAALLPAAALALVATSSSPASAASSAAPAGPASAGAAGSEPTPATPSEPASGGTPSAPGANAPVPPAAPATREGQAAPSTPAQTPTEPTEQTGPAGSRAGAAPTTGGATPGNGASEGASPQGAPEGEEPPVVPHVRVDLPEPLPAPAPVKRASVQPLRNPPARGVSLNASDEATPSAPGSGETAPTSGDPSGTPATGAGAGTRTSDPAGVGRLVLFPLALSQSSQPATRASGADARRPRVAAVGPSAASSGGKAVAIDPAGASAEALLAPSTEGPRARSVPSGRHGHASARVSGGSTAVGGTVARIVGVVPQAVWIVVGVLALLSLSLAAGSWLAAVRARRLARQRRRLADDVGALQAALLPDVPERISGVRTSVAYRPAEGPAAGGDFYDLFAIGDGRVAVIVGDISGHGRAALPQTALIRYTARAYLDAGLSPRAALRAAAAALEHQLDHDCFATALLAIYDPGGRSLTYASAGHPPPIILGTERLTPVLAASSPPIGLGLETGRRQTVVSLPGAARACFFTDGVVEARADGELFGAERLAAALGSLAPGESAQDLLARVVEGTDRRPDDMAACLLELEGTPVPARIRIDELVLDHEELSRGRAASFLVSCGLGQGQVKSTLRRARTAVEHAGAAVLRVRFGENGPRVEIEQARRTFVRGGRARVGEASLGSSVVP